MVGPCPFPSRIHHGQQLSTRQSARLMQEWVASIGLDPWFHGTHSLRCTKPRLNYGQAKNFRAVQLLPGHTKLEGADWRLTTRMALAGAPTQSRQLLDRPGPLARAVRSNLTGYGIRSQRSCTPLRTPDRHRDRPCTPHGVQRVARIAWHTHRRSVRTRLQETLRLRVPHVHTLQCRPSQRPLKACSSLIVGNPPFRASRRPDDRCNVPSRLDLWQDSRPSS